VRVMRHSSPGRLNNCMRWRSWPCQPPQRRLSANDPVVMIVMMMQRSRSHAALLRRRHARLRVQDVPLLPLRQRRRQQPRANADQNNAAHCAVATVVVPIVHPDQVRASQTGKLCAEPRAVWSDAGLSESRNAGRVLPPLPDGHWRSSSAAHPIELACYGQPAVRSAGSAFSSACRCRCPGGPI
jgi:hypothetical protein